MAEEISEDVHDKNSGVTGSTLSPRPGLIRSSGQLGSTSSFGQWPARLLGSASNQETLTLL